MGCFGICPLRFLASRGGNGMTLMTIGVQEVLIDIKPGVFPTINLGSNGTVPVAILKFGHV